MYLVDERIAILMSYNEMSMVLEQIFCKHPRAMKFFMRYDRNPKLERQVTKEPTVEDYSTLRKDQYDCDYES